MACECLASGGAVLIVGNLVYELHRHLLPRDCHVLSGRMRIQVTATGLLTYPDVIVVCGEPQFLDVETETLLNPTVLIEVSSPRAMIMTALASSNITSPFRLFANTSSSHPIECAPNFSRALRTMSGS